MGASPRPQARACRRRILIASLGTLAIVVLAAATLFMVRGNDFPSAHGQPGPTADRFPDVTVEGADGAPITTASLAGTPTLVWFSDSACPDPDGARRIARFDDNTGGYALRILVVLIDRPADSAVARQWRAAFGRPDWLVVPDRNGEISAKAGVRMPETKMLLDEHTTILDTRTGLVDDAYLGLLAERVQP